MIAKQSIGKSFMGALGYNLKKMREGPEGKRAELLGTNFIGLDRGTVRKELAMVKALNPKLTRDTYHTSLNFSVDDKLPNNKMLSIATDYMQGMGFDNNLYFVFRHNDAQHPHCHILALRTRFNGTVVSDSNNYKRSEQLVRKLEKKYGLSPVTGSALSPIKAPDKDELEMVQRTGKASKKMIMQGMVQDAIGQSGNMKEFIRHLGNQGIYALFNQAGTGRVSGITYFMPGFKAKGQALGNQFKWHQIIKQLDYEQIRDGKEISEANRRAREKYGTARGKAIGQSRAGRGAVGIDEKPTNNIEQPAGTDERDKGKYPVERGQERPGGTNGNGRRVEKLPETDKGNPEHRVPHLADTLTFIGHLFDSMAFDNPVSDEDEKRKRRKSRGR